jgi:hypothetical protein
MYTADNYVLYVASLRRPTNARCTQRSFMSGTCGPATAPAHLPHGKESFPAYSERDVGILANTTTPKGYDSDDSVESWSDDDEIWDSEDETVGKADEQDSLLFVFDEDADPEFVAEMEAAFPAYVCSKEGMTEDYEENTEANEETLDFIAKVNAASKGEMEEEWDGNIEDAEDSDYEDSDDEDSEDEEADHFDDWLEREAIDDGVANPSSGWGMRCTIL